MSTLNHKLKIKTWFTLVELIVVISILAILWTIAFLSFSWYSSKSRDSVRISDIANISKWLELYNVVAWTYPLPDNSTTFTWSTWSVIKQWVLWDNVSRIIKLSKAVVDPLTNSNYIYSVFNDWKYYQLYYEKENITWYNYNTNSNINTVYADTTTSTKIPVIKWNYTFDPSLPSLFVISGSVNTNSWIFDPNVCFITNWWTNTISSNPSTCIKKKDMNLKDYDSSLVGYWDMETLSGTMLKDLSGNGNDGIITWTYIVNWLIGKARSFTGWGVINQVEILNSPSLDIWGTGSMLSYETIFRANSLSKIWQNILYKWTLPDDINIGYSNRQYASRINKTEYVIHSSTSVNNIGITQTYFGSKIWSTQKEKYYLMTAVIDSTSSEMKIYLNGIYQSKTSFSNSGIRNSTGSLFFWSNHWNFAFDWVIDDIKIYNRILSDSEILQHAKIAGF